MAFTFLARRSNIAGHVPTIGQLNQGEITLNTNDGLLYFLANVAGSSTVICLGPTPPTANALTSPVTIALSNAISGSASFNGANNITIATSLAAFGSAGTYSGSVVNQYGLINGTAMTATGDLSGTSVRTNIALTLASSGVAAGTYNYGTLVINAKGLITAISTPTVTYAGDLSGSAALGSNVALTLANTVTSPGTFRWGLVANKKGLVTASLGSYAATFATAGYQVLPSGFILQWGTGNIYAGVLGADASTTVTFTTAFPTKVLNIQLTNTDGSFSPTYGFFYSAPLSNSTTSFTFYYNCQLGVPTPTYFLWQAIGH